MPFEPYFPFPTEPGHLWIEWAEVLYVNGAVLVRCIPLPEVALPNGASTVLLRFEEVVALRISEDPFNLEKLDLSTGVPREKNKGITSLLLRSRDTTWTREAADFHPSSLYHFVILDVQDHAVGLLTRKDAPTVQFEHQLSDPEPHPNAFATRRHQ